MGPTGRTARRAAALGLGLAIGGGGVGYGLYRKRLAENQAVTPAEFHAAQGAHFATLLQESGPQVRERAARGLQLFRFQTCPFCGTVKALLDYFSLPHYIVEVDPMLKQPLKVHGYGRVPHLKFPDGTILVDSEEITNLLAGKLGLKRTPEVDHWRQWARQQLARYIVVVLNRTLADSVRAYSYIDAVPEVPAWSKLLLKAVGGPAMYLVAEYQTKRRLQREFGLTNPDAQAALFQQLDMWIDSHKGQKFHGGKEPDLADLDAFGILLSTRHRPLWEAIRSHTKARQWIDDLDALLARNRRELA